MIREKGEIGTAKAIAEGARPKMGKRSGGHPGDFVKRRQRVEKEGDALRSFAQGCKTMQIGEGRRKSAGHGCAERIAAADKHREG